MIFSFALAVKRFKLGGEPIINSCSTLFEIPKIYRADITKSLILKPILEKNGVFGKSNDKFYTDIKTQWKVWSGDNI